MYLFCYYKGNKSKKGGLIHKSKFKGPTKK